MAPTSKEIPDEPHHGFGVLPESSGELQLVEDLWEDLAATSEAMPVHDWQKEELARRKVNLLQNLSLGLSWEEVKRRIRGRYGR